MKHLKTFENYDFSQFTGYNTERDPDLDDDRPEVKNYVYRIVSEEEEDLRGDVRSEDGEDVFEVTQALIDEKVMRNPSDVKGLREYLIKKRRMKKHDTITIDGNDPEGEIATVATGVGSHVPVSTAAAP